MSKITPQTKDFSQWYNEIVLESQLADYSDIKGCMIIRPYGYALWENIQRIMDQKIKNLDVENVYLPMFIPENYLQKEAEHIEGFAPEVAWVTEAGGKKLEERLAIRPTSETIMYKTFAKWVASYRDLPLKVNQWANIVRWEMRTRLFLRTTEFLWQEGHTLHRNEDEAQKMVDSALHMYKDFAENYLAISVIEGNKPEWDKFAGAKHTKCIEGLMRDGKALQMGTSHLLNQEFAKSFDVKFLTEQDAEETPWPTSWGISTRLIGGIIMAHGDDIGLILPPKIAPIQVIIVPIWKEETEKKAVEKYIESIKPQLNNLKYKIDWDDTKTPGWKFSQWEMKGVPLRIEIGPKDIKNNQITLARRDTQTKETGPISNLEVTIHDILDQIQNNLLSKHKKFTEDSTYTTDDYNEFKKIIEEKGGFVKTHHCGDPACEEKIQHETKATIRCIPAIQNNQNGHCVACGKDSISEVFFAKAY